MQQDIIQNYAEAVVPNTYTILGTTLHPLSLGHVILMQRHNLPWVSYEKEDPSFWALIYGIFICSKTWAEYHKWIKETNEWSWVQSKISKFLLQHEWFFRFEFLRKYYYEKWENDIREFIVELAKVSSKDKSFNVVQKIVLFDKYIKEHQRYPRFFIKDNNRPKTTASENQDQWVENVLTTLCGKFGYDREKVLNMPLGNALYDYLKYAEENDLIEITNEDSNIIINKV